MSKERKVELAWDNIDELHVGQTFHGNSFYLQTYQKKKKTSFLSSVLD